MLAENAEMFSVVSSSKVRGGIFGVTGYQLSFSSVYFQHTLPLN